MSFNYDIPTGALNGLNQSIQQGFVNPELLMNDPVAFLKLQSAMQLFNNIIGFYSTSIKWNGDMITGIISKI